MGLAGLPRPVLAAMAGAGLFLLMQFVPVERSNPPVQADLQAPAAVREVLVRACYDCHSHETQWPWYSRIAPMSWWIAGHVADGRKDLNFSRWPTFDFAGQELILAEIEKQVASGHMPPRSYAFGHPEARLTGAEKEVLLQWIRAGVGAEDDPWR